MGEVILPSEQSLSQDFSVCLMDRHLVVKKTFPDRQNLPRIFNYDIFEVIITSLPNNLSSNIGLNYK